MSGIKLTVSQAINGFFLDRRLKFTEATVENYRWAFDKFTSHWEDDPSLEAITADDIRHFLDDHRQLSNTSRRNIHSVLSSLWTWATEEGYADRHIIRQVTAPEPEQRAVVPFSQADVKAMLKACNKGARYIRPGKKECANTRPTAARDRAIIILLVDTGIRATELCDLHIQDLDLSNGRLKVMGKGVKERLVPVGHSAARVLWRYLPPAPRPSPSIPSLSAIAQPLLHSIATICTASSSASAIALALSMPIRTDSGILLPSTFCAMMAMFTPCRPSLAILPSRCARFTLLWLSKTRTTPTGVPRLRITGDYREIGREGR